MRNIEEGIDIEGTQCWFVLENAELVGVYYSLEEAENLL
jgi:hypothetical protein